METTFTHRMPHDITNFWIRVISVDHKNSEFNWHKLANDDLNKNKTIGSDIKETTFRLQAKYNDTTIQVNCSRLQFGGRICYPSPNTSSSHTVCGDGCIGGIINGIIVGIFSFAGAIAAAIITRRNTIVNP